MIPGQNAMRDLVADCRTGKLRIVRSLYGLLRPGFGLHVSRSRSAREVLQRLEAGLAAVRDADLHSSVERAGIGLGHRFRSNGGILGADQSREVIGLFGSRCI